MKQLQAILLLPLAVLILAFGSFKSAEITWYSLTEAQQLAKSNNKKVLVFAEASWCGYCKKMDNEVFTVPAVQDSLQKYYYPVRVDIESDKKLRFNDKIMTGNQFAREHRVAGTPTTFFIDKEGVILGAQPGFIPANTFKNLLSFVGSDAYGNIEFEEYVENHRKKK